MESTKNKTVFVWLFAFFALVALIAYPKMTVKKQTQLVNNSSDNSLKIRVAYPALGTAYTGEIGTILQKTDVLKKNKLDAQVTPYGTGREMKVAMVSDQADVMLTSDCVALIMLGQGYQGYLINSLGVDGKIALIVNDNSAVRDVKNLKGKKVGTIFGTSAHKPAVQWINEAGLTPDKDVTLVNLPDAATIRTALATKQIDAAALWDPFVTDGLNKKQYRVLKDTDLNLIAVMSKKFADQHPQAIYQFNSSIKDAVLYLSQNKTEVSKWYSDSSKMDQSLIEQVSFKNKNYNVDKLESIKLSISPEFSLNLQDTSKFLLNQKLINNSLDVVSYIKQ